MARKQITTKVCTKSGKSFPATTEFFYKDKSQKDGLSPWSKDAERAYNAAYAAGLKKAGVARVKDMTDAQRKAFDKAMAKERVTRGKAKAPAATKPATRRRTTKAKAA